MNTEKFCLKWDDFRNNIIESIPELKEDFCDVTLASEGNHQINAHRVILSASSPLLRDMLRNNTHSHPLLYMRKIKARDLTNIVTFMYNGEVNILQEDLNEFLSLAEELELKGLTGSDPPPEEEQQRQKTKQKNKTGKSWIAPPILKDNDQTFTDLLEDFKDIDSVSNNEGVRAVVPIDKFEKHIVYEAENITDKIDSLIEKRNGAWTCKVCGKVPARNTPSEITRHAEIHLEGVSHECDQCGTVARSSRALSSHVSKFHRVY